ncbi:MAG: serine hydrolase domain-containing protein [Planctomycetota bacterium]|jgi:CubicO group peptidase (beta-lactamase class C family)
MNMKTAISIVAVTIALSPVAIARQNTSVKSPKDARRLPAMIDELRGDPFSDFGRSWQNAPHNTFVYQQISRAFPTAVVWRGDGEESVFQYAKQELGEISFENIKGDKETLSALLKRSFTNGFLVLKDGRIITEEYRNGLKPHIRHHWMSASKSLTSTLFGTFVDEGKIKLDELVTTYVPELKGTAWSGVRVADVLDMRSDVLYREEFDNPVAEVWQHESAVGWRNVGLGKPATNRQFLANMQKYKEPDGLFHYRSSETDILGWIMEEITGIGAAELLSQRIWSKLGAEEDAQCIVDREGAAIVMGGFGTTLRDGARWAQMIANGGRFNNRQIISAKWVERIRQGNHKLFKKYYGMLPKGAYSAQFWVTDVNRKITSALGYGGQMIYIDKDINLVIVKFSTWDTPNYDYAIDTYRAFEAVSNHFRKTAKQ